MDIFSIITLLGGLALFLYGMTAMSNGLEKMAGSRLEAILKKLTSNRFRGLLLGTVVTAVIQSSSAVTVMLVGLVNSGVMQLSQTTSVVMGSSIGTTITAWILSLSGIEGSNVWLNLLKPENFSPILAFIGILLIMISKSQKKKDGGSILIGFAILMFGMEMMSGAVKPISETPQFTSLLTAFSNPILGVIIGALFTAAIQSSSASVGVLQALSLTGTITYNTAIPIITGQNIGACVAAFIASFGTIKNAKRVALIHFLFKIIGTVLFLSIWTLAKTVFVVSFADDIVKPYNIAIIHTAFNVISTIILFPFANLIEKLSCRIIKDSDTKEKAALLDERLMTVPSVAVAKAFEVTIEMSTTAKSAVDKSMALIRKYSDKEADEVAKMEEKIDRFEDELGTYLIKLSALEVTEADGNQISKMLHTISDFERIGDHASNLVSVAQEIHSKGITFSEEAKKELAVLYNALNEIMSITYSSFEKNDTEKAKTVEPLEEVIDKLVIEIKNRHINRLRNGECTIEIGFVLTDLLTNIERISDHCSNIAVAVIESAHGTFDAHEYLDTMKSQDLAEFSKNYSSYRKKYAI